MIGKISRGSRPGDIGRYLHGEGHLGEHTYQREDGHPMPGGVVIGGNLAREGAINEKRWAGDLRLAAAARPDAVRPIWHTSLRCAPGDRRLSDEEWRDAVQEIATEMGWNQHPHVIVRHADDHVHVVMSRVGYDGRIWRGNNDARRLQEARQDVEKRLGLRQVPTRGPKTVRTGRDARIKPGEYRRAVDTGKVPERADLAYRVQAAVTAAEGQGRTVFEQALRHAGIEHQANIASTGRVSGYRFHLPEHTDAQGKPVWWKASQLDRSLSWTAIGPRIGQTTRPEPAEVQPKRLLESKSSYAQRASEATQQARRQHEDMIVKRLDQASTISVPDADHKVWKTAHQDRVSRVKKRQNSLEVAAVIRNVYPEPEGGWRSLKQVDRAAAAQQTPVRERRSTPGDTPTISEYQQRQRRQQRDTGPEISR